MNYHAKSGAYSLKIDCVMLNLAFCSHFFLVAFLFFVNKNLKRVIMNYLAKFGASILKID